MRRWKDTDTYYGTGPSPWRDGLRWSIGGAMLGAFLVGVLVGSVLAWPS